MGKVTVSAGGGPATSSGPCVCCCCCRNNDGYNEDEDYTPINCCYAPGAMLAFTAAWRDRFGNTYTYDLSPAVMNPENCGFWPENGATNTMNGVEQPPISGAAAVSFDITLNQLLWSPEFCPTVPGDCDGVDEYSSPGPDSNGNTDIEMNLTITNNACNELDTNPLP